MALINPELIKAARFSLSQNWAPTGSLEKAAIVPPGGGDPSGGAGGAPPGADPSAGAGGGPPPGMAPPGADPSAAAGGPPSGPLDQASIMQIVSAVQAAGGGAAGGAGGKGKNPKEQLQAAKDKIQIHLLAQIASKLGVQVDPQLLVPPADPGGEQMAMQELQTSPMMPGGDPNASGDPMAAAGGAPPPGGDPSGGAGGPAPVAPMDAGQGPIGKAASFQARIAEVLDPQTKEASIGQEYTLPKVRENRNKAAAFALMIRSLGGSS